MASRDLEPAPPPSLHPLASFRLQDPDGAGVRHARLYRLDPQTGEETLLSPFHTGSEGRGMLVWPVPGDPPPDQMVVFAEDRAGSRLAQFVGMAIPGAGDAPSSTHSEDGWSLELTRTVDWQVPDPSDRSAEAAGSEETRRSRSTSRTRHPAAAAVEEGQAEEVIRVLGQIDCLELVRVFAPGSGPGMLEGFPQDLDTADLRTLAEEDLAGVDLLLDFTGRERVREVAAAREATPQTTAETGGTLHDGPPFFFLPGCEVYLGGERGLEALAYRAGLLPVEPKERE